MVGLHQAFSSTSRSLFAVAVILVGTVLSTGVAQGRVDPTSSVNQAAESEDTVSKATGGGTVFANPMPDRTVSSFGLNARRPVGFTTGGFAEGRINYDRHKGGTGRHVNAPVILMQSENSGTPRPERDRRLCIDRRRLHCGRRHVPCRTTCRPSSTCRGQLGLGSELRRLQVFFCSQRSTATPTAGLSNPNAELQ